MAAKAELAEKVTTALEANGYLKNDCRLIAPIAIRRWNSFSRRHPKHNQPTPADRITDLRVGLRDHFEPAWRLPASDYEYFAQIAGGVLLKEST